MRRGLQTVGLAGHECANAEEGNASEGAAGFQSLLAAGDSEQPNPEHRRSVCPCQFAAPEFDVRVRWGVVVRYDFQRSVAV